MESVNFQGIIVLRLNEDLWDEHDVAVAIQRSNGGLSVWRRRTTTTTTTKTTILLPPPPPTTTTPAMMVMTTTIVTNSKL
jgi:uncharacterized membrane protein YcaP (DUF421 family)